MTELRESYEKVLLVDDREPKGLVAKLSAQCTIPIKFERLKTGDYVCDNEIIVERKTINDFALSIIDRRLFKQYDRLKEFPHAYIFISGKLGQVKSKISRHAILGAIAFLAHSKITVIKVENDDDLIYLILKIFEQFGKLKVIPNGGKKK